MVTGSTFHNVPTTTDQDVATYANSDVQNRFLLPKTGIFERVCTRLLLVNGMEDSIFPIEDAMLALGRVRVKEARFLDAKGHVGNPGAEEVTEVASLSAVHTDQKLQIVYDWIDQCIQRS